MAREATVIRGRGAIPLRDGDEHRHPRFAKVEPCRYAVHPVHGGGEVLPPLPDWKWVPRGVPCRAMHTPNRKAVRIRPKTQTARGIPHRLAVFTSMDGTLLDARTFEAGASRAAVRGLLDAGVPVIPVSVMTLDELEPIAADLGLRHSMIIEAGGAIARWSGRQWEVEPCGPPADTLLDVVRDIEDRSGASLLVYSAPCFSARSS